MRQGLILMLLFGFIAAVPAEDETHLAGEEVFEFRCADTCHDQPDIQQFTPKQWRIVLNTMQKRMHKAGMERMTEQEFEQVLYYLTAGR